MRMGMGQSTNISAPNFHKPHTVSCLYIFLCFAGYRRLHIYVSICGAQSELVSLGCGVELAEIWYKLLQTAADYNWCKSLQISVAAVKLAKSVGGNTQARIAMHSCARAYRSLPIGFQIPSLPNSNSPKGRWPSTS